jgi:hypothetical protein
MRRHLSSSFRHTTLASPIHQPVWKNSQGRVSGVTLYPTSLYTNNTSVSNFCIGVTVHAAPDFQERVSRLVTIMNQRGVDTFTAHQY